MSAWHAYPGDRVEIRCVPNRKGTFSMFDKHDRAFLIVHATRPFVLRANIAWGPQPRSRAYRFLTALRDRFA